MMCDGGVDLVTGAFSYSGSAIAELLLDSGRQVKTITFHPERAHPLQSRIDASPYRFDDPVALARSLEGVTTLYNTYWVRFDHGPTTFANAVSNSRTLFAAARRAGVSRVVHVSIANPSIESPLRGTAATRSSPCTSRTSRESAYAPPTSQGPDRRRRRPGDGVLR